MKGKSRSLYTLQAGKTSFKIYFDPNIRFLWIYKENNTITSKFINESRENWGLCLHPLSFGNTVWQRGKADRPEYWKLKGNLPSPKTRCKLDRKSTRFLWNSAFSWEQKPKQTNKPTQPTQTSRDSKHSWQKPFAPIPSLGYLSLTYLLSWGNLCFLLAGSTMAWHRANIV